MKKLALGALALFPSLVFADRLITVPMSIKVPRGELDFSTLYRTGDKRFESWMSYGLNRHVDLEIYTSDAVREGKRFSGGFAYQLLPAIEDTSPGIAIGVQDVANITGRGRVGYLAFTYRSANSGDYNQDVPSELTFGFWTYDKGLFYVGAKLPLSNQFWLIGEHDGEDLNWGASLTVSPSANVRFLFMRGRSTLELTTRVAF
ncbi:MAG: hypothetical protein ABUL72_03265 [Armatimonadota bacterium]